MTDGETEAERATELSDVIDAYSEPPQGLMEIVESPIEFLDNIEHVVTDLLLIPSRMDRDLGTAIQNLEDYPETLGTFILNIPHDILKTAKPKNVLAFAEAYSDTLEELDKLPGKSRREIIEDISDLIELTPGQ